MRKLVIGVVVLLFGFNVHGQIDISGHWIEKDKYNRVYQFTQTDSLLISPNTFSNSHFNNKEFKYSHSNESVDLYFNNKVFESLKIIQLDVDVLTMIQSSNGDSVKLVRSMTNINSNDLQLILNNERFRITFYQTDSIIDEFSFWINEPAFYNIVPDFRKCNKKKYSFKTNIYEFGNILTLSIISEHLNIDHRILINKLDQNEIRGYSLDKQHSVKIESIEHKLPIFNLDNSKFLGEYVLEVTKLPESKKEDHDVDKYQIKFNFMENNRFIIFDQLQESSYFGEWKIIQYPEISILQLQYEDSSKKLLDINMVITSVDPNYLMLYEINCNFEFDSSIKLEKK